MKWLANLFRRRKEKRVPCAILFGPYQVQGGVRLPADYVEPFPEIDPSLIPERQQ